METADDTEKQKLSLELESIFDGTWKPTNTSTTLNGTFIGRQDNTPAYNKPGVFNAKIF
jgi:hypothetical protein